MKQSPLLLMQLRASADLVPLLKGTFCLSLACYVGCRRPQVPWPCHSRILASSGPSPTPSGGLL